MQIKEVKCKIISDSRNEDTVEVTIDTNVGKFTASSPNGKSKGNHETKPYKKTIEEDVLALEKLSDYFSSEYIDKFGDLRRIEDIVKGHIGGNTQLALEYAALKALAKEQEKQVWQLINPKANKIPRLLGNVIGGGLHSEFIDDKRPDFQEFLLSPKSNSAIESFKILKESKEELERLLRDKDAKFKGKKNDENAWMTSLNEREVLDILNKLDISTGVDIAAAGFYKRKKYHYKNPMLDRTAEEQLMYISNLIKNLRILYIEDAFDEDDFESFAKLLSRHPRSLIVGDDLTVTNYKRLEKAIQMKSINALIIKPNQNGSLVEVARVVELAKKHNIKTIFSHRSGETMENILSDIAFGFGADFIKCGITGDVREVKVNRMIEIKEALK